MVGRGAAELDRSGRTRSHPALDQAIRGYDAGPLVVGNDAVDENVALTPKGRKRRDSGG